MKKTLIVLLTLAAGLVSCATVPEQAGNKLFWKSPQPTGQVLGRYGVRDCYTTVRILEEPLARDAIYAGKSPVFYNPNECPLALSSPYDIVLPSDAEMRKAWDYRQGDKARARPDGSIEFY